MASGTLPSEKENDTELSNQDGVPGEISLLVSAEAFWTRRKAQLLAQVRNFQEEFLDNVESKETDGSQCHICNVGLGLIKFRHHCRNCNRPVCGVHSKNHVPLPNLGIMKEVRVCDICVRNLFQRRAGYRSPKKKSSGSFEDTPEATNDTNDEEKTKASTTSMCGVIYSCMLEEQDNTVDEILYLGTFKMGGRALASRRMSANVAIWKDRMFMLTTAEMLCFKVQEDSVLGEVRSSIHLTEIVHIEINEQFPRILTVVRADGRIFRIRAKSPEQCQEICEAVKNAMALFQEAMHKLQRGPQPEDNVISCVTIQHESSLSERVVVSSPSLGQYFEVEMYPSSILRFYVNGPDASGIAQYSCEMLLSRAGLDIVAEAEALRSNSSDHVLHAHVRVEKVSSSSETNDHSIAHITVLGVVFATLLHLIGLLYIEILIWILLSIRLLIHFHERVNLFLVTKRFQRATQFKISCYQILLGKSDEEAPELISDEELDRRFLEGCNGQVEEAKRRYMQTMQWRKNNDIDNILLRPQPHFKVMKESHTHVIHKKDKFGHPITIEFLGSMKKDTEAFLGRGVTEDEALNHMVFIQEHLWNVIDPRPYPMGTQLKILDIRGISMSDIGGETFAYWKKLGQTIALYNPERLDQVFILNPPSWFQIIWKLVSPMINPKTRDRTRVIRGQKDISKALLEFVDPENLPEEYGGTCRCEGGCLKNSPEEVDLRNYVNHLNFGEDCQARLEAFRKKNMQVLKEIESRIEKTAKDPVPPIIEEK